MAQKSNIRSMRFSDKMIQMIESQAGDSFTAKFEALVTRCMWELPKREEELKQINKLIDQKRKDLQRISKYASDLENSIYRFKSNIEIYSNQTEIATKNLKKMLDEV